MKRGHPLFLLLLSLSSLNAFLTFLLPPHHSSYHFLLANSLFLLLFGNFLLLLLRPKPDEQLEIGVWRGVEPQLPVCLLLSLSPSHLLLDVHMIDLDPLPPRYCRSRRLNLTAPLNVILPPRFGTGCILPVKKAFTRRDHTLRWKG